MQTKILLIIAILALSLNAAPKKELNILLFGETGSGKSTLINIFYNHMKERKYSDPRDIIVPLMVLGRRFEVNVAEYKNLNVKLKPDGSSQTDRIRAYKLENEKYIVTFWDTPGFMDTRGEALDEQHMNQMAIFLAQTPIHAVALVLGQMDLARKSPNYQNSIDSIRGLLPKSFLGNITGIYNRHTSSYRECSDDSAERVGELFGIEANMRLPKVYCVYGSGMFSRPETLLHSDLTMKTELAYWDYDKETTQQLLLETKTNTVLNLTEVKRIQELQRKIQDSIDPMSELFQLIEFQKSNLTILESKKGDFSEKIELCKTEIKRLESERTEKIKELVSLQSELKQLAMKTHPVDAYIWYLGTLLSRPEKDFTISQDGYGRQKQLYQDWTGIYRSTIEIVPDL